jgi:hypothetical protein
MTPFAKIAAVALLCLGSATFALPASAEESATQNAVADPRQGNNIVWRGDVDGTIEISLRHRSVRINVVSGRSVRRQHQNYRVQGFLPARPLTVRLENVQGPGTVEVTQQPDEANNFTAVVRVTNNEPSRAEFRFTLAW